MLFSAVWIVISGAVFLGGMFSIVAGLAVYWFDGPDADVMLIAGLPFTVVGGAALVFGFVLLARANRARRSHRRKLREYQAE